MFTKWILPIVEILIRHPTQSTQSWGRVVQRDRYSIGKNQDSFYFDIPSFLTSDGSSILYIQIQQRMFLAIVECMLDKILYHKIKPKFIG